jgi:CheY-like chemotaxis protein
MKPPLSILLVDDNLSQLRTLSMILRAGGFALDTAESGEIALKKAREKRFDLVFLDMVMPDSKDLQVFQNLQMLLPEAIIVLVTAYAVEELIEQALAQGAAGVLYKPLDLDRVFVLLSQASQGARGRLLLALGNGHDSIALQKTLSRLGYHTMLVHHGDDAIQHAQHIPFDVLFVETHLPVMNGVQIYQSIRTLQPDIETVLITPRPQQESDLIEEGIRNSVTACLTKPVDLTEIVSLLSRILKRKTRQPDLLEN